MRKLLFYGASGFGEEIVQLFRDINTEQEQWELVGYLDDDPSVIGSVRNGLQVLGDGKWLENIEIREYWFVCCIGNPKVRREIVSSLTERGAHFATGVHPSVISSDSVRIDEGSMITATNVFTTNIKVGKHVIFNLACTVGHYCVIEDFVTVNPGVNISGDVTLKKGCYLGTNASILEKLTVGSWSTIGAGAVATKDIPANVTAVGVPARIIKRDTADP